MFSFNKQLLKLFTSQFIVIHSKVSDLRLGLPAAACFHVSTNQLQIPHKRVFQAVSLRTSILKAVVSSLGLDTNKAEYCIISSVFTDKFKNTVTPPIAQKFRRESNFAEVRIEDAYGEIYG